MDKRFRESTPMVHMLDPKKNPIESPRWFFLCGRSTVVSLDGEPMCAGVDYRAMLEGCDDVTCGECADVFFGEAG